MHGELHDLSSEELERMMYASERRIEALREYMGYLASILSKRGLTIEENKNETVE